MFAHRAFPRRLVQHALVIGAVAASVVLAASGTAFAQTPPSSDAGPRFGQWGPGQSAPAPEGPTGGDTAPRSAPNTAPGTQGDALPGPYAAPAPGYAPGLPPAPYPGPDRWGGCNHDLRGSWQISGRQTDPYDFGYQAQIYVRQYRNWLQIDQPGDNLSYYGTCRGDEIELDVYVGGRFVGYEDGVVGWGGGRSPWSSSSSPWAPGNTGRVRATWTSFAAGFATGHETWRRW
jgi:hypothetical protein